jgi:hypothetical protein
VADTDILRSVCLNVRSLLFRVDIDWRRPVGLEGRSGGEPILDTGGDRDRLVSDRLLKALVESRRPAMLPSPPNFRPGKPSEDSPRYMGVAMGSIETADRIGNTLSMDPGLSTDSALFDPCEGVGDGARSDLPVNIDTDVSFGVKGGTCDLSSGV